MIAAAEIRDDLQAFLAREWLGNSLERWLEFAAILLAVFLALGLAKRLVQLRLAKVAERTSTDLDDLFVDLVKRTTRFFLFTTSLYVAQHWIRWPSADTNADGVADGISKYELYIGKALVVVAWIQVGLWGRGLVEYGIGRVVRGKGRDDPARKMGVAVLGFVGQVVVWSLVLLLCLEALGVNVNSLIASLGVGGIAVALAAQNVLGDLFASIAILLDKPFVVGDGVQVGEFNGTVEQIGVKTTRLRSVNGEEIVMGNNDLVASRIRNFKRLEERRVVARIGILYETPHEQVRAVPAILREIVEARSEARFDRAHFQSFGDSALIFELVYFARSPDYGVMMDLQQEVNLAIHARFERERIGFAYPTQTVRLVREPDADRDGTPARGDQNELSLG